MNLYRQLGAYKQVEVSELSLHVFAGHGQIGESGLAFSVFDFLRGGIGGGGDTY